MDNKFSFPVIIPARNDDDDQFEFGCATTPGSPNSPADRLFANGKLLPHVFPIQTGPDTNYYSFSRSASRTSSISSKDYSLVSSRSNSRSSNCSSSARTSTSEASSFSGRGLSSNRLPAGKERNGVAHHGHRPVLGPQVYGSSQRWQLIAAAPVLKKQQTGSRPKVEVLERTVSRKSRPVEENGGGDKTSWFGKRILKSLVSACKECHAITT